MGAPEKRSVPGKWVFRSMFRTVEVLPIVVRAFKNLRWRKVEMKIKLKQNY